MTESVQRIPRVAFDVELSEYVAHVTLKGPGKGNALGPDFWREAPAVFDEIDADSEIRAVVLDGAGGNFTFGLDLIAMTSELRYALAAPPGSGPSGASAYDVSSLARNSSAATTSAASAKSTKPKKAEPNDEEDKKQEALDLTLETIEALVAERGAGEQIWGSMVKQALKRRKPGFTESYYGFRSFSELLEEAEKRHLLKLQRDDKSGGYILNIL